MLDVRRLRNELDSVIELLARKGVDASEPRRAAELDERHRAALAKVEELRAEVKRLSKGGRPDEATVARSRELKELEREADAQVADLHGQLRELLLRLPNTPSPEAFVGASEADNPIVRTEGFDPDSYGEHQRVPHWDIGASLGILDLERAVKISGSMFSMFRGSGATLARAMCQYALDLNADAFEEVRPPSLVLTDTLVATGQLPKFADDAYHVERDDQWLIPTAEVPLTSLARDETIDEAALPVRLMAYSPCYRREAGSAGRDTRGLLRVHEFDKVEVLAYCTPAQAEQLHTELLERCIRPLRDLGLPVRVVEICTGDLGQSHARQFDLEVYAPGVDRWLEASSVSWFSDYQARRANIRYKPAAGGPTAHVHTLNGSALAVPRVWAALVETYRQPDGSVAVPAPLLPYMRGSSIL